MTLKWAVNKKTCHFCKEESQFYNHPLRRYTCLDKHEYQKCEAFKVIDEHLRTCPVCKPIYDSLDLCDKYAYNKYKCFTFKYILRQARNEPLGHSKLKSDIQKGLVKCEICNERKARYAVTNRPCCEDTIKKCPGFHKYISKIHIKKYKDQPELRIRMSEVMKESQNKESVSNAKRLAMLHLHHDPCEKCKDFQSNFAKAQKARRGPNYLKFKNYTEKYKRRINNDAE